MKAWLVIILLLLIVPTHKSLGQIGAKTQQGKIYGLWQNNQFGYQMTLMLNTDGTGEFDGDPIRFTSQATILSITQEGVKTNYTFALQNNSLTLSGGDLDEAITFTRSGEKTAPAQKATTTSSVKTTDSDIVGIWSNYGETVEFKANHECIYQQQVFPYQVSGNTIMLQTAQGTVSMPYVVSGNTMNLTINGQEFTYTRGKAGSNATATGKPAPAGKGNLDLSLVGKWCAVNVNSTNSGGSSSTECITINANGTFEYYSERSMSVNTNELAGGTSSQGSDRGTWWVEGDRIHYQSQTQGAGSYQLQKRNHPKNGDPMIVLDGSTYVTQYQKAPWN